MGAVKPECQFFCCVLRQVVAVQSLSQDVEIPAGHQRWGASACCTVTALLHTLLLFGVLGLTVSMLIGAGMRP